MSSVSAAKDNEERKLCDCEGCTMRRFAMLEHIEAMPANKLVCEALPIPNAPSVTTLQ